MSKHSLFASKQMAFEVPYVLDADGALIESPYLLDAFHEPVVTVDTDLPEGEEGWELVFTSAYESGIWKTGITEGVALKEAEQLLQDHGYMKFLYLTDQTEADQVTPTGKYALVHGRFYKN